MFQYKYIFLKFKSKIYLFANCFHCYFFQISVVKDFFQIFSDFVILKGNKKFEKQFKVVDNVKSPMGKTFSSKLKAHHRLLRRLFRDLRNPLPMNHSWISFCQQSYAWGVLLKWLLFYLIIINDYDVNSPLPAFVLLFALPFAVEDFLGASLSSSLYSLTSSDSSSSSE